MAYHAQEENRSEIFSAKHVNQQTQVDYLAAKPNGRTFWAWAGKIVAGCSLVNLMFVLLFGSAEPAHIKPVMWAGAITAILATTGGCCLWFGIAAYTSLFLLPLLLLSALVAWAVALLYVHSRWGLSFESRAVNQPVLYAAGLLVASCLLLMLVWLTGGKSIWYIFLLAG